MASLPLRDVSSTGYDEDARSHDHSARVRVRVVMVYVREAHAKDAWPIGDTVSRSVTEPTVDQEREVLAMRLRKELGCRLPIYLDPVLGNPFEAAFACWPFRFYIVDGQGKLRYKAMPTKELTYCTTELENALTAALGATR